MKKRIEALGMGGIIMIGLFLFVGLLIVATQSPVMATLASMGFIGFGTLYTEPNKISDVILEELDTQASRDKVTVLTGQNLLIGTVIGKAIIGALTETHAGNTGNGAMTIDATTPALANCQAGVYSVKCITASANAGTFEVFDPKGNSLGIVAVAGTFANQIKFVIADGSTDFIVGDTFLVTAAAGTGKVTILTPAALDGTQTAYGIIADAYDATSADVVGAAIVRNALVIDDGLVWPGGISAANKAAALAQLAANHITTRQGV